MLCGVAREVNAAARVSVCRILAAGAALEFDRDAMQDKLPVNIAN
jgi:hypothetical protein